MPVSQRRKRARPGSEAQRAAESPSSSNFARLYLSRTFIATLDVVARLETLSPRRSARKLASAGSEWKLQRVLEVPQGAVRQRGNRRWDTSSLCGVETL